MGTARGDSGRREKVPWNLGSANLDQKLKWGLQKSGNVGGVTVYGSDGGGPMIRDMIGVVEFQRFLS
ncbi:conserved hypothetical protein [Ricinus communis]|uniref:Uncharacterized protein n=1 Tax=Ricinus communis TaxID=3988 RepID=B9SB32_RICCO|nr:conserved hypothetical protein [Ricinus communis]